MITMSPPVPARGTVTAAEYSRLAELPGTRTELVRGEVVVMSRPGFRHGVVVGNLFSVLREYQKRTRHGRAVLETGIITERNPDTVRGPDIAYWSAERLPLDQEPVGYPETPADLAVEILSPSNRPGPMRDKVAEYFRAGVRMVWLIDPDDRSVWCYTSPDEARVVYETATLTGADVLPDFACPVAELFAE